MACECLTGYPCEDKAGNCSCVDDPQLCGTGGIKPGPQDAGGIMFPQTSKYFSRMGASIVANQNAPECSHLTAPKGYHYIYTGGGCALAVNYDGDNRTFARNQSGIGVIDNIQNVLSDSPFIQNNKGLLLLGVAGIAAYFAFGRGMKPKSRTVESRTRY